MLVTGYGYGIICTKRDQFVGITSLMHYRNHGYSIEYLNNSYQIVRNVYYVKGEAQGIVTLGRHNKYFLNDRCYLGKLRGKSKYIYKRKIKM